MYLPRVCLQICTYVVTLHMFPLSHYDLFQVGNKDMTRVLLYNICWHIFCSLTLNPQNCRTILLLTKLFGSSFVALCPWQLINLEMSNFENRIFVSIFLTAPAWEKHQQIFEIRISTRPNRWATKDIKQFLLKAYSIRK